MLDRCCKNPMLFQVDARCLSISLEPNSTNYSYTKVEPLSPEARKCLCQAWTTDIDRIMLFVYIAGRSVRGTYGGPCTWLLIALDAADSVCYILEWVLCVWSKGLIQSINSVRL